MANNFSWLIENKLAGMERPGLNCTIDDEIDFLKSESIDVVVTLEERQHASQKLRSLFEYHHFPIDDFGVPELADTDTLITMMKNKIEKENKKILVHCYAGIGRTGTILACYLIKNGSTYEKAIEEVRRKRPGSIQSREQELFIMDYYFYTQE